MARYIDADKLLEQVNSLEQLARKRVYDTPTNSPAYERYATQYHEREKMLAILKAQPTADVAPNSEVEQWYHEYHTIKDELKQEKTYHRETEKLADKYCVELQTAKSEVAREIFAEIEENIFENLNRNYADRYFNLIVKIAELKKKYTEGEK
jgi:hypothetical protein